MSRLFDPDSTLMTALSTLMDFFVFSILHSCKGNIIWLIGLYLKR